MKTHRASSARKPSGDSTIASASSSTKTNGRVVRKADYATIYGLACDAGLSRGKSREFANKVITWRRSCGLEWTLKRLKSMRDWYLTYLAGSPVVPSWAAHTRSGLPKDAFGDIFRLKTPQALMCLNVGTLFGCLKSATQEQIDKFLSGLEGNGFIPDPDVTQRLMSDAEKVKVRVRRMRPVAQTLPTKLCITGNSIPVTNRKTMILEGFSVDEGKHVAKTEERITQAYIESWKAVPQETLEYLATDHLDWVPPNVIGGQWTISLDGRQQGQYVGNIGFIQQHWMKLRSVANPNRITQHSTFPLGHLWYSVVRQLPCDTTFYPDKGVVWASVALSRGVTLASVDMTSATDLLDLRMCIELVNSVYFKYLEHDEYYTDLVDYFTKLSRGLWWSEALGRFVSWKQGQPLGLYPSFALLTLTNNALARIACLRAGIPLDSYMCHGDDMVIDARAAEHYVELVRSIGGEINLSKTLTSNVVAEFDGMIVTKDMIINKTIKFDRFGDDSFLSYAQAYGPKVRRYMLPRQRKVYDELKFIPGILVPGPWMRDSFGYSLAERYSWYLETILEPRLEPDLRETQTVGDVLLRMQYSVEDLHHQQSPEDKDFLDLPWAIDETAYQADSQTRVESGDPRKWRLKGVSILKAAEKRIKETSFVSFLRFIMDRKDS